MSSICIIPARGGSKRIPRKNIKEFCGKPIIAYSIEAALGSSIFDEVMVSTDDDEIAEVAQNYGAKVPFMRSAKASDDHATTMDVLAEVLAGYSKLGKNFDQICCLYPCAPFVTPKLLCDCIKTISSNTCDSAMTVCKFPVPIEWAIDISAGMIEFKDESATQIRSQDLQPYYFDVGLFYFAKVDLLLKEDSLTPGKCLPVVISESQVHDIDTIDDWNTAETKYMMLKGIHV